MDLLPIELASDAPLPSKYFLKDILSIWILLKAFMFVEVLKKFPLSTEVFFKIPRPLEDILKDICFWISPSFKVLLLLAEILWISCQDVLRGL